MLLGVVAFPIFRHLSPLLPWLIFLMLFFTFCKINPIDLRLHRWHWIVLGLQLGLAIGIYYLLEMMRNIFSTITPEVSQGLMLCLIMPTATAAPIIAGKLGGSIQNLTAFTILSNLSTAIVVPLFFPLIYNEAGLSFATASWLILRKVSPLLLSPFVAAWLVRLIYDAHQQALGSDKRFHLSTQWAQVPFYLWAGSLVILMANITDTMLHTEFTLSMVLWLAIGAAVTCVGQFYIGHVVGKRWPAPNRGQDYRDVVINPDAVPTTMSGVSRITAGQAMGQKNTTLGVWMAQTYLLPMAALGAAAYIVWQNLYNSWQLHQAAQSAKDCK